MRILQVINRREWPASIVWVIATSTGIAAGLAATMQGVTPTAGLVLPLLATSFGARARLAPFLAVTALYLVCLSGLLSGANDYYGNLHQALFGQLGVVLVAVLLGALWTLPGRFARTDRTMAMAMGSIMVVLLLPPLWLVGGLAHPVVSLGYVWAGGSWIAVLAGLSVLALVAGKLRDRPLAHQLALIAVVLGAGWVLPSEPLNVAGNERFRAVSTAWGSRDDGKGDEMLDRLQAVGRLVDKLAPLGVQWIVLPEATISRWTPAIEDLYITEVVERAQVQGMTVWLGVSSDAQGRPAKMGAMSFTPKAYSTGTGMGAQLAGLDFIPVRQPMPLSLWTPWRSDGATAAWFPLRHVNSPAGPVYVSACYEDVMAGMMLASFAINGKPAAIVSMASNWYLPESTRRLHLRQVEGIAKLFRVPLLRSTNTARSITTPTVGISN